ncbi:MAG: DNA polymerase III subunit delta' [Aestuariivirga sp.]
MAEEKEDPRETPWHPRHAQHIRGHKQARDTISAAFASGKAHHAWLFAGPRGVGKATLAYALARGILSGLPPAEYFAHEPVGQHAKWIAAKAHPDMKVLERRWDDKKLKTEIVVDDARELGAFLSLTSGSGKWRIVIVDAADDLNINAANSLLKLIEEPPPRTLLMLVAHNPGRVLRTIRSRCVTLKFDPLSEDDALAVLRGLSLPGHHNDQELLAALHLAPGSPGRAIELIDAPGAQAFRAYLAHRPRGIAHTAAFAAKHFQRLGRMDDVEIFGALLQEWLAKQAKESPQPALADAYNSIGQSIRMAAAFNLDQRQTVAESLGLADDALKRA